RGQGYRGIRKNWLLSRATAGFQLPRLRPPIPRNSKLANVGDYAPDCRTLGHFSYFADEELLGQTASWCEQERRPPSGSQGTIRASYPPSRHPRVRRDGMALLLQPTEPIRPLSTEHCSDLRCRTRTGHCNPRNRRNLALGYLDPPRAQGTPWLP